MDRRRFDSNTVAYRFLDSYLISQSLEWISSFELGQFFWSVLIEELIDRQVAATDLDLDLASLHPDHDFFRAKFVHS